MSKEHEDKGKMTKAYELGYHLVPSLAEDDLALRVTDLQKAITAEGGSVISEGQPQSFTLAYPMRKMRGGRWDHYESTFFGWIRFDAPASAMELIKDFLEHNEYLVRYLVVKLEKIALTSAPVYEQKVKTREVETEPKTLVKKQDEEETGEVVEEELDKQIEELIK